jgi:hypothetical protein
MEYSHQGEQERVKDLVFVDVADLQENMSTSWHFTHFIHVSYI